MNNKISEAFKIGPDEPNCNDQDEMCGLLGKCVLFTDFLYQYQAHKARVAGLNGFDDQEWQTFLDRTQSHSDNCLRQKLMFAVVKRARKQK